MAPIHFKRGTVEIISDNPLQGDYNDYVCQN